MPLTRSKAAAAKNKVQCSASQGAPHDSPEEDGASILGAPAVPAPSCPTPMETASHESMVSLSTATKSARSGKSSSDTLKARILAAKAEHARKLAEAQTAREQAQAEREIAQANAQADRERQVAELELQAELAALEAGSSHRIPGGSSRHSSGSSHHSQEPLQKTQSRRLQDWLTHPTNFKPDNHAHFYVDRENDVPPNSRVQVASPTAFDASTGLHPCCHAKPAEYTHNTLGVGTRNNNNCCLQNKTDNENLGTHFNQLAKAITDLTKTKTKVCELSKFDGCASAWLMFKKSYEQSKAHYTPADNINRISAALHGAAREAVAIRLVAADDPDQIVQALETRFAQPEVIVLHQLSMVRALPRLSEAAPRDINTFACRIRNCVEVIRLLNQPEYLASPELVNTIISKFSPLLRSRWADFASTRVGNRKFKFELLADFLENESFLQTKFGIIFSEPTSVKIQNSSIVKCQPVVHTKDKIFPYVVSADSFVKAKSSCKYCTQATHEIGDCDKFLSLSLDDRWRWVLDNKVCRKCLRKGSHQYKNCKKRCKVHDCKLNWQHHTVLHGPRLENSAHIEVEPQLNGASTSCAYGPTPSATVAHSTAPAAFTKPLLKVIPVTLTGDKGSVSTYALLDDGSSATLVDEEIADMLVNKKVKTPLQISCVGGLSKLTYASFIDISVQGQHCTVSYDLRARSIPNLGLRAQSASIQDISQYEHLADIAHGLAYEDAKPTCIIGTDNWHLLLPQKTVRGSNSEPAAALTPLGWALFGFIDSKINRVEFVNHVGLDSDEQGLDCLIKSYYKLDSIGIQKIHYQTPSNKRALQILEKTTVRLPSGRFETGLLWRNNLGHIPDSKPLAMSRFLSLERKMAKDKDYAIVYRQNIHSMIDKGYAELCTSPPSGDISWYLPHFGVVHPQKKKLRVVHDAAARCNGVSLNSMLLAGPDLLQPLLAVIMRFREGCVALTADIREMFPQIKIRVQDRDAQRFFWRDDPQQPIQEYRMSSMIFGATSSPCTALFLKNRNAQDVQHRYPEAVRCIIEDHYMDDFIGSVSSAEEAARLALEIVTIHKAAGFEMRSWVSNNPNSLSLISSDLHLTNPSEVGLGPTSLTQTRVLGLTWLVMNDSLCFLKSIPKLPDVYTKRSVLSLLMSVYDPLGIITPLVMKGRIIFQKTWKLGLGWDHKLPEVLILKWKSWFQELQGLAGGAIPRCYSEGYPVKEAQLHVFTDASELAYACVAYWRFTLSDGSIKLALIGSKSRLAPLKPTTIPRLELQSALIGARFANYIIDAHRIKPCKIFMWSDSITVLKWLRSDACTFKPFVAFRVGEISDLTDIQNWRYIPTAMNVADDATRDTRDFHMQSRWFTGPSFLLSSEDLWPREPTDGVPQVTEEYKNADSFCFVVNTNSELVLVPSYQRFSSWLRLLRATARVYQAAKIFRSSKAFRTSPRCSRNFLVLSADELNHAEICLFKIIQRDSFSDELVCVDAGRPVSSHSRLKNVSLSFGQDGLLRLSGRTTTSYELESRPIVLDGKHQITRLLIHSYHTRFAHANNELVVNELRQRFYVVGLRPSVKQVASRCQACRIQKAKPIIPPTGNLPHSRIAHHERPFSYVGLDYFGPISVTIGRRTAKRWIALFTCLTIRAIHLEIVESLSTDSAIMSIRRFIARRGCPECIYSDNGTAFVGAAKVLPDLYEFASTRRIRWKFIPPSAPFMGGCWERLIRNVKNALNVTLKEKSPKEEVLNTLLLEAEAIVNSRPLTHVSVDPDSETAITPFSFLIGSSSNDIQNRQFDDTDLSSRAQWRKSQRLAEHFWQRFVVEYLPTLVPRRGSPQVSRELQIGDMVCIADGTLPRRCWPRGRIVATFPGKDNVVRVADVATKGGVLRRPTRKLALLIAS